MRSLPPPSCGCALPPNTICSGPTPVAISASRVEVGEHQVGALVRRGAPRESDREHLRVERDAGARGDRRDHRLLRFGVRRANLGERNADGVAQIQVVRPPLGDAPVEQASETPATSTCRRALRS